MKKTKAILSVILSVTMLFTLLMPGLAAENGCNCGNVPVVQVRGIGETLYDGEGNEIFSAENIVNGILPVIPELTEFLITWNTDVLVDGLSKAVKSIFGPVSYDNNLKRDSVVTVNNYTSDPIETYKDLTDEWHKNHHVINSSDRLALSGNVGDSDILQYGKFFSLS